MVDAHSRNNPAPGISPISGIFVVRPGVLGDLKAVLEDTISGHGNLVMLIAIPPWLRQKADQARRAVDFDHLAVLKLVH